MYTLLKIGNTEYKLRLTIINVIALEQSLGYSPLTILFNLRVNYPTITSLIKVLHYSMLDQHPDMTFEKATELMQQYLSEGGDTNKLILKFTEVFKESGLVPKHESKNT